MKTRTPISKAVSLLLSTVLSVTVSFGQQAALTQNTKEPVYLTPNVSKHALYVCFSNAVRFDNPNYTKIVALAVPGMKTITAEFQPHFEKGIAISDEKLDFLEKEAVRISKTGESVRKLRNIVRVTIEDPSNERLFALANKLLALPEVLYCDLLPLEAIQPPGDIAPTTPNYEAAQTYINANPGVNMTYAWGLGLNGAGIRVRDVEYGFNPNHEDLVDKNVAYSLAVSPSVNPDWLDHGTATFGVMYAHKGNYGVSGMAHGAAEVRMFSEYGVSGYNRVNGVSTAINNSQAGDVILFEMQTGGQNNNYVPAEYTQAIWDLTKAASDAGIIIVAAAGNGNENLDGSFYNSYMNRGNSGAIMVGAGSANAGHNKMYFSTYGSRVDVQGWGENVRSCGYGDYSELGGDPNQSYTNFSGTSSATPVVASCVIVLQSYYHSINGSYMTSTQMRNLLIQTGIAQGTGGHIGPLPNMQAAIQAIAPSAPTPANQPSAATVCASSNTSFTATFNNSPTSYQWQLSTNGGGSWNNVNNGGVYTNATTGTLNITGATAGMNGYQYRCTGTNSSGSANSNAATLTVNAQATPSFTQLAAFCSGATAPTLPGTSANSIPGTWSPSTVSNTASGTYTFTPTAGQCATTATMNITVNPTPTAPTITAGGPLTFCQGGSVVLTSSASSGNNWSTGGTGNTITVNSPGTYTVTQTANGCTSPASSSVTVTVNPTPTAPTITAGGPLTFCQGGSVVLTSSASSGNNWSTGGTGNTITVNSSGTYTVTQTVSGCTSPASSSVTVTVTAPVVINSGTTVNPTTCGSSTGSVEITGTGTGSVSWSGAASGTQPATLPVTIPNLAAGGYTFTFTSSGCTSTPITATLSDPNAPPAPVVTAGGPMTFCEGGSVVLTSSAANGNNWSTGETGTSITVTSPGTYTVSTTVSGCTSAASTPVTITVNPVPSTPTISAGGPTTFCQGGSVVLTSSAANGNTWSTGAMGTSVTVTAPGTITLTAAENGCESEEASITVTVNPNPTVNFGNVNDLCVYTNPVTLTQGSPAGGTYSGTGVSSSQFTPAAAGVGNHTITYSYTDGNSCTGTATTVIEVGECLSVDEIGKTAIVLFPNPSQGSFTVDAGDVVIDNILVYDNTGRLVRTIAGSNETKAYVDLLDMASGTYTVQVTTPVARQNVLVMLAR